MAAKLKVQNFRANDLSHDSGKQVEFGRVWCEDFFEIDRSASTHTVTLLYKPLSVDQIGLTDKAIELTFGEVTKRGDRKAYAKGSSGYSQIKKFFIDDLHLTEANLNDYFAIYKTSLNEFYLYFVPALLYSNFINLFRDIEVSGPEPDNVSAPLNLPHQQIFYGAPGTGKSNTIKKEVDEKDRINFRTTFHPDSDYSTFVGCYKPRTKEVPMRDVTGKVIVEEGHLVTEKCIEYSFVPQAFTKAYTAAWNTEEPVFLIIEEINRGNCAQIFGDLFQLLDRKNGESEYPIDADTDLASHIARKLANSTREIPEDVKSGRLLKLPANLYIWATMNTSDQSLFPIDSAFKRRWEWQYMPIAQGRKDGKPIAWRIGADGNEYDWWSFVQKINEQIGTTTSSEDKKLGFFFAKADSAGLISADKFVGKVLFYLWNDVFKDYGLDGGIFALEDVDGALTYDKFYTVDTTGKTVVRKDLVEKFLAKLGVEKVNSETFIDEDSTDGISNNNFARYSLNGSKAMGKSELGYRIMDKYLAEHPESTFEQIKQTFPDTLTAGVPNKGLIVELTTDLASYARYYANKQYHSVDGVDFRIFKQWTIRNIDNIIAFAKGQGWSVEEAGNWDRKEL